MSCPGSPSPRSKENARGCDGGVNAGGGGGTAPVSGSQTAGALEATLPLTRAVPNARPTVSRGRGAVLAKV